MQIRQVIKFELKFHSSSGRIQAASTIVHHHNFRLFPSPMIFLCCSLPPLPSPSETPARNSCSMHVSHGTPTTTTTSFASDLRVSLQTRPNVNPRQQQRCLSELFNDCIAYYSAAGFCICICIYSWFDAVYHIVIIFLHMNFGVVVSLFFYYHKYSVSGIMMFFSLLDPTRRQEARWLSGASALISDGVRTSFGQ
jgi:hypothetical protein